MNTHPFTRIALSSSSSRMLALLKAGLVAALLSSAAFAAPPPPSAEDAQSRSARLAGAQEILISSYAQFRESRAKAIAEYKAKIAECDKLQADAKTACVKEAKAARKQAFKVASAANSRNIQEAYLKAPELKPASVSPW